MTLDVKLPCGGPISYSMRTKLVLSQSKTKIQHNKIALLPMPKDKFHPPSISSTMPQQPLVGQGIVIIGLLNTLTPNDL
jgi:hypothetical protein